jgi:hypothetical protein
MGDPSRQGGHHSWTNVGMGKAVSGSGLAIGSPHKIGGSADALYEGGTGHALTARLSVLEYDYPGRLQAGKGALEVYRSHRKSLDSQFLWISNAP